MKTNIEKFELLISDQISGWHKDAEERSVNKDWRDKAFDIALIIINYINDHNLTQVKLADKIGVSKQYINRLLQGKENLTLESICKIENALNISLINLNIYNYGVEEFNHKVTAQELIPHAKEVTAKIENPYNVHLPKAV